MNKIDELRVNMLVDFSSQVCVSCRNNNNNIPKDTISTPQSFSEKVVQMQQNILDNPKNIAYEITKVINNRQQQPLPWPRSRDTIHPQ